MKAVQIKNYGGSDKLEINEIADPVVAANQIEVEVKAAAINPFDIKLASGMYQNVIPLQFPITLGGDFSGIVKQVGEHINGFTAGDEVYGTANILSGGSGSFAQKCLVNANRLAIKPKSIDFVEAAALVLVGVSAIQALEEHINLLQGEKILIHGGGGGIGHIAIQVAKSIGAYVITTVSQSDREFVKKLGADEVINYENQDFTKMVDNMDAVFDTVGGEVLRKSLTVLRLGGRLVSMVGPLNEKGISVGQQIQVQQTKINSSRLNRLTQFVDEGKIKVKIDKVFALEEVVPAFEYFKSAHHRGKVVLQIV